MPLVTVVIPLYNKYTYIGRALCSVFKQSINDYEIIVVDDGSTDGGAEFVESFNDHRLRLIRQDNAGPSQARNRGLQDSRGKYIAFLDADDEWCPEFVSRAVGLLEEYPLAGACGLGYALVDEDGTITPAPINRIGPAPWRGIIQDFFVASMKYPPLHPSAAMIRREALMTVRPKTCPDRLGEDQYFFFQFALSYPIAYDNTTVSAYYHRDACGRVCDTLNYHKELPYITLIRERLQSGDLINTKNIEVFIAKSQLFTAKRILVNQRKTDVIRSILKDCPWVSGYRFRLIILWLKLYIHSTITHLRNEMADGSANNGLKASDRGHRRRRWVP